MQTIFRIPVMAANLSDSVLKSRMLSLLGAILEEDKLATAEVMLLLVSTSCSDHLPETCLFASQRWPPCLLPRAHRNPFDLVFWKIFIHSFMHESHHQATKKPARRTNNIAL